MQDEIYSNQNKNMLKTCFNVEKIIDLNPEYDFKDNIDIIFVNGGLTDVLIEKLYKHKQFEIIKTLVFDKNVLYIGESAEKLIQYIDMNDFVKVSKFNKIENGLFEPSDNFSEFVSVLKENDVKYKLFKSSGQKIGVGCGQMVTHYNKTKIKRK